MNFTPNAGYLSLQISEPAALKLAKNESYDAGGETTSLSLNTQIIILLHI